VQQTRQESGNDAVEYLLGDFASQAAVRHMAAQYQERYDRLDVLINNAGAFFLRRGETEDGIERTFAVNHLAPFLLTLLLLDTLKASAPARIVNVSSEAHEGARLDLDDVQLRHGYTGMKAYGRSKLANLYFTYELARRLQGSGVTVNALHPGFVATNLGADNFPLVGRLAKALVNLFARDVAKGAQTSIYLACAPEVTGVTGKYFVDCEPVASSPVSYDREAARRLWQISARLVDLPAG
jgi:NAD(P)-dependent dehydrogenase (short-subunit alcohol dehydrogenase family)